MNNIYVLDKREMIINILSNNSHNSNNSPFFDDLLTEDLTTGGDILKFSTIFNDKNSKTLVVGNYIAYMDEQNIYRLFQIMTVDEIHSDSMEIEVYCESCGLSLINSVFRKTSIASCDIRKFLETVLEDTEWNVGTIDMALENTTSLELETASVYSILQNNIKKFDAELRFRCELNNGRISSKFVDAYYTRGKITNRRFEFGKNISKIRRNIDSTELYTALIGEGKNGLNFRDITLAEIPNKAQGQDFVFDQESYDKYNKNGYHLMGIFKYDTDSPEELLRETYKKLQEVKNPKITYEVDIEMFDEKLMIGDTINIIDFFFNPPLLLNARVSKLETSKTNKDNNKCTLSNFVEANTNINAELLSHLKDFVNNTVGDKFPIGGEDIKEDSIGGKHIYKSSISTEHLQANSIDADKIQANQIRADHIDAKQILSEHIEARQIKAEHIEAGAINAEHIETGSITAESGIIADAAIGNAQIKDAEITVAKIQNAFIDDLVANQGKFQSAHIGVLTSNNIDTNTLKAEHITTNVIDAINMNVSGKIKADRIDVKGLTVEELDAGKITTGYLNSDRIEAGSIEADKLSVNSITTDKIQANAITTEKISANSITAEKLKAGIITGDKISGNTITGNKIQANTIESKHLKVGIIDTDHINSGTITAIGINASEIVSNKITSGEIKVGNANIIDGTISGAKISSASISEAQISKATITDASIKSLNASKITAGTLDCGRLDVKNLKADSITTGSITVEGNNLLHNTDFKEKGLWTGDGIVDSTRRYQLCNTLRFDAFGSAYSEFIPATKGGTFVISLKSFCETTPETGKAVLIIFEEYAANSTDRLVYQETQINTTAGSWKEYCKSWKILNDATTRVRVRIYQRGTVKTWIAQPMLSKGSIASAWKLHNDELISNGAIDSDKIANEAINSDKLNIDELFVGDNAFIRSLKAVEIDASSITTGKISNERIDISGLVSFEALNDDLKGNFQIIEGKTLINGGMIATDSIKANSIDLKGLTIKNKANDITFAVAKEGDITVNAEIRTKNYNNDTNEGYILRTDGTAELNQVKIRGEIELPNAGITNFGALLGNPNILTNSDFAKYEINNNIGWDDSLNGNLSISGWSTFNKGIPNSNTGYHSHLFLSKFDVPVVRFKNVDDRWLGLSQNVIGVIKAGTKYTFSMDVYGEEEGLKPYGGLHYRLNGATSNSFHSGLFEFNISKAGQWKRYNWSFVISENMDESVIPTFYIYGNRGRGTFYVKDLKLEIGDKATPWCPNENDGINATRFWAGSDYSNRNNAPFRVTQDGSLFASKGTFQGRVLGERVDIGKIHLHDNEIVINDTSRFIDEKGKVREITPYDYDSTAHLKLGKDFSFINTDFILGNSENRKLEYLKGSNQLSISNINFSLKSMTTQLNSQLSNEYDKGIEFKSNISGNNGSVVMNFRGNDEEEPDWKNTFVVMKTGGSGSKYGDIFFRDKHWDNRISVGIRGSLQVTSSIKSETQNIEIRSVSSEGWGFFAM